MHINMRVNFGKYAGQICNKICILQFYAMICNSMHVICIFIQKKKLPIRFFFNLTTFNPHLKYPTYATKYAILCNNKHCIKMHKNKTNMQLHRFAYPDYYQYTKK